MYLCVFEFKFLTRTFRTSTCQMHARMERAVDDDDDSCAGGSHLRIMLASPRSKDDVVLVITRDESA